jgi:hypothetical protein
MMFKGERYAQIHGREWPIERVYEVPASADSCDATIRSQWTSVSSRRRTIVGRVRTHIIIIQSNMYDSMSRFDGMCIDFRFMVA